MPVRSGSRPLWLLATGLIVAALGLVGVGSAVNSARQAQADSQGRLPQKPPRGNDAAHASQSGGQLSAFPTRTWTVPADLLEHLNRALVPDNPFADPNDPFADPGDTFADPEAPFADAASGAPTVQQAFHREGIPFPRGTWAVLDAYAGTLEVRHEHSYLEKIGDILTGLGPLPQWTLDRALLDPGPNLHGLPKGWESDYLATEHKLRSIVVPEVRLEGTTVGEAIAFLNRAASEHDHEETDRRYRGLKITVDPHLTEARLRELKLANVPIATVLQYICDDPAIRFRVDHDGVEVFSIHGSDDALKSRQWHVAPELVERVRVGRVTRAAYERVIDDPFRDKAGIPYEQWLAGQHHRPLSELFKDIGVSFPEGARLEYDPDASRLTLVNTPYNLDLIDVLFESAAFDLSRERFMASQGR